MATRKSKRLAANGSNPREGETSPDEGEGSQRGERREGDSDQHDDRRVSVGAALGLTPRQCKGVNLREAKAHDNAEAAAARLGGSLLEGAAARRSGRARRLEKETESPR